MTLTLVAGDDWKPEFWGAVEAAAVVEGDTVLDELGEPCEVIEVTDLGSDLNQVVLLVRTPSGIVAHLRLDRQELVEIDASQPEE